MKTDAQILYQLSPDVSRSVSSLWHLFQKASRRISWKQWPDSRFIAFGTNPSFKSAHQAKLQGCFPITTNNAQRELLGNTSPIYTFFETAWNTAQDDFSPLAFPSPPPRDLKAVQMRKDGPSIHSMFINMFHAASLFTIILMQSSHEQANNFNEKFMQFTALCFWQGVQLFKVNTKCTHFESKHAVSRVNTNGVINRLWADRRSPTNFTL